MKHFTKQQIDEIEQALIARSKKDSSFPAVESLTGEELIPLVQDGKNKVTSYTGLFDQVSEDMREYVDSALDSKVDVEEGKQLSTEDYTTEEKEKLAGIEAGAEVNVNADWEAESGDAVILNKPDLTVYATVASLEDIQALIPDAATSVNQLADKNFVNSSISTSTAEFRGTYNSLVELESQAANLNDYGFVVSTDEQGNTIYNRYKYTSDGWVYEYSLNNSSFTSAQWEAINSGATAALIEKLSALPTNESLTTSLDNKVDKISGKGLSTNDYTTAEKTKLAGIEEGAEVNILEGVQVDGTDLTISNKKVNVVLSDKVNVPESDAHESDSFLFRQVGGGLDIDVANARVDTIKGNSIAWNQLVSAVSVNTTLLPTSIYSYSYADGVFTLAAADSITEDTTAYRWIINNSVIDNAISTHYYLTKTIISECSGFTLEEEDTIQVGATRITGVTDLSDTIGTYASIELGSSGNIGRFFVTNKYIIVSAGATLVGRQMVFDLTLMFGAGNEPSSVAEFEAWYWRNYYTYNAGSLLSFKGTQMESVGFNQWDEEWEVGMISTSTGADTTGTTTIRSTNYIPVFAETTYYFCNSLSGVIFFYDADYNYLSYVQKANATFTTPSGAAYLRFRMSSEYGTTYNNDICINLSNTALNGQYFPYQKSVLDLSWIYALKDADGNKVFADGLKRAGTAFDWVDPAGGKGQKVIGVVDLGSLTWGKMTDGGNGSNLTYFRAAISGRAAGVNYVLSKYGFPLGTTRWSLVDKSTTPYNITEDKICICDSSYDNYTAADFKTAMSGVYLIYELSTPIDLTFEPAVGFDYKTSIVGTERILPDNGEEPTTAPCNMDITYSEAALSDMNIEGMTDYVKKGEIKPSCNSEAFNHRKSTSEVEGYLHLAEVRGWSARYNQLVQNGNFASINAWSSSDVILSVSNNVATFIAFAQYGMLYQSSSVRYSLISTHKYLILTNISATSPSDILLQVRLNDQTANVMSQTCTSGVNSNIFTAATTALAFIRIVDSRASNWDEVSVSNVMLFDLTLMGIDDLTTVSEVEAYLAKNFGQMDYYPYSAGEIRNFEADALRVPGFNKWDEEWELGGYSSSTGAKDTATNTIRSKNAIPVFPNTTYYLNGNGNAVFVYWYDADGSFISYTSATSTTIVSPSNARYLRFRMTSAYGTTYAHDICINLSDSRNGEYEPYKGNDLDLSFLGTMRKVNDTVLDTYDGKTKKTMVGEVDLGTLSWVADTTGDISGFYAVISTKALGGFNISCSKYVTAVSGYGWGANMVDKTIVGYTSLARVYVRDDSYTDATTFASAISGVKLIYELVTPTYETIERAMVVPKEAESTECVIADEYVCLDADVEYHETVLKDLNVSGMEKYVTRDELSGDIPGNAATATALETARTINGTSFDGTTDITTAKWGTSRSINIASYDSSYPGNSSVIDGSSNKTMTLAENIKANLFGRASTAVDGHVESATDQSFSYRQVADGELSYDYSTAKVKTLKGYSLSWNQQFYNGDVSDGTTGWQTSTYYTISESDGVIRLTEGSTAPSSGYNILAQTAEQRTANPKVAGHKYLIAFDYLATTEVSSFIFSLLFCGVQINITASLNTWTRHAIIIEAADSYSTFLMTNTSQTLGEGGTLDFKNLMCIDLTLMFGSGNEPSTVDEFTSIFPNTYYAYNAGTPLSFTGTGIKSTGVNQWDEQWESGTIDASTGEDQVDSGHIRSKNFCACLPETDYYIKTPSASLSVLIFFYDGNYNYITYETGNNSIITSPSNAVYFRIRSNSSGEIITYGYNITVNISNSDVNGTYYPYEEHITDLSWIYALKDSNNNTPFADGVKSAGSVCDEIGETRADNRIGAVDLGSLTWTLSTLGYFLATLPSAAASVAAATDIPNILCAKYSVDSAGNVYNLTTNKTITTSPGGNQAWAYDSSYTDATTFTSAMSGVMLYYELATPIEITYDKTIMAGAINKYGTVQIISTDPSAPDTTPIVCDIQYGMTQGDLLGYIQTAIRQAVASLT